MAVDRVRARLLRDEFPRFQMLVLVALTGLAGFGASAALLAAGVESMALRYLLAMGAAYIAFLSLLRLWLWLWLRTTTWNHGDGTTGDLPGGPSGRHAADVHGGGGSFDGGGASGNVDFAPADGGIDAVVGKPLAAVTHADEGAIPLAVLLLVVGITLSSLFVVWTAPALFAEIMVDALLATGLYRPLRLLDPRHWMRAALKRTVAPFILTTLAMTLSGFVMQVKAPGANSLGQVLAQRHAASPR